ncbi:MAG: cupin domain-containing protein [Elusimicrobiota bacterium]|nr:MAG: cupin domain-containing protein [Elusimicrobiota bacterium]
MDWGLDALLKPIRTRDFMSRNWERKPLLIRRRAAVYAGLFAESDLDAAIRQARHADVTAMLRIVKRQGDRLTTTVPPLTPSGYPDIHALYRLFADGHTLIVNAIDQRWGPVSSLCRTLERDLDHRIGANAYFTPPAREDSFLTSTITTSSFSNSPARNPGGFTLRAWRCRCKANATTSIRQG